MNNVEVWHYLEHGVTMGPVTRPAMEGLIRAGSITRDSMVWPGYGDWIAAGTSSLGPVFGGGIAPPVVVKKDFLPQDKGLRTAIMVVVALIGLYFVFRGVQQVREGMGGGSPSNGEVSINFQGCRGISASTVQCGYVNTGTVERKLCMDVVVMCTDGRHVASTCSDKMKPGESSTKLVDNFKPGITATNSCSGMTYENMKGS